MLVVPRFEGDHTVTIPGSNLIDAARGDHFGDPLFPFPGRKVVIATGRSIPCFRAEFMKTEPVILEGGHVKLVPLAVDHARELWEAGADPELWRFTSARISTEDEMRAYIEVALAERARGVTLPFATLLRSSGQVIGTTRFAAIVPDHRRAEIGWTFVAPAFQRTGANTEAKYLMFRHGFEVWGLNRLELKTSARNMKSRTAILGVGAQEEGTLRRHMVNPDGTVRDTVYFSVVAEEWPEVRSRLEARLARGSGGLLL